MKTIKVKHWNDWSNLIFANQEDMPGELGVMFHITGERLIIVSEDDTAYASVDGHLHIDVPDDFDDSKNQSYYCAYLIPRIAGSGWLLEQLTAMYYPHNPEDWYYPPGTKSSDN